MGSYGGMLSLRRESSSVNEQDLSERGVRRSMPLLLVFLFVLLRSGDNVGKIVSQTSVHHGQKLLWKTIPVAHVHDVRIALQNTPLVDVKNG